MMILLYFYVHIIILCAIFACIIILIVMTSLYGTTINTSMGIVKAKVEILVFKKDELFLIYSPSFNLSSYGNTKKEALYEFNSMFCSHIKFCIENGTLEEDLQENGWQITEDGKFIQPTRAWMLENNDIYREIIEKEDFHIENIYCKSAA